jgi:outer membrane protein assembly factor BamB/tetratricopeptide (TPR) repeat protein
MPVQLFSNPSMRPLLRRVAVLLLAAALAHGFAAISARADIEPLETGIHFPVDANWNSEYSRVEELLRRTEWNEAVERLLQLAQRLDQIASGEIPSDARTFTVPTGGGFALGARAALQRLLLLLPDERHSRLQAILDAELVELWRKSQEASSAEERASFRHYLLHTQPASATALAAAREEIDASLEIGALDRARFACRFVRSHGASQLEERVKSTWILIEIADVENDPVSFKQERQELESLLDSGREQAHAVTLPNARAAWLRERLDSLSKQNVGNPGDAANGGGADGDEGGGDQDNGKLARDGVISPLILGSISSASRGKPFELGSVQARRPFEYPELRSHVEARVRPNSPVITPVTIAPVTDSSAIGEGEPVAGDTPDASPVSRGPAADIALPFYPVALNNRLYAQTYREIVAFDLESLEESWARTLDEETFEALDTLRSPAVHIDRVLVITGAQLAAFSSADGTPLWEGACVYDRVLKALSVRQGTVAEVLGTPEEPKESEESTEDTETDENENENDEEDAEGDDSPTAGKDKTDFSNQPTVLPARLSPAVAYLDDFIVAASVKVESEILVYLTALDRNGKERWSTYLGSVESSDYLGMGSTVSIPLVVDGYAYVLTNLGFLASVDVVDGQIRWLQAYGRLTDQGKVQSIRDRRRWQANPILARDGLLYLAPQDTDSLVCIDAPTGEIVWKFPRDVHTTMLGFHDGKLILGGRSIRALALDGESHGRAVWRWKPPNTNLISLGRSALVRDRVLVSDLNALYTIDLSTGKELSVALWDFRGGGGNLAPLPSGHLAVASSGGILIYNDLRREHERIEALRPGSAERLLELAKLELKSGQLDRGMQLLREWSESEPFSPPRNSPLDRVLFEISEALRYTVDIQGETAPLSADLLRLLMKIERNPNGRAVAAFRAAQIYLQRNRPHEAIKTVAAALKAKLAEVSCPVHEFLAIPGRVFAESILEEARTSGEAGREAFTEFEWDAQRALSQARRVGTQSEFQDVVTHFPLTRAGGLAQIELANYYQEQLNLGKAAHWLLEYLRAFPAAPNYVQVALRAADVYVELGLYAEARDLLVNLSTVRGDDVVSPEHARTKGETVKQHVDHRLADPGFREIRAPLEGPWLRFPAQMRWRSPANLLTTKREFLSPSGKRPETLDGHFLTHSRDLVECRDVHTGLQRWVVQFAMVPGMQIEKNRFRQRNPITRFVGKLLVYANTTDIIGVDCDTGVVRWHIPVVPEKSKLGSNRTTPAKDETADATKLPRDRPRGPQGNIIRAPRASDKVRGIGSSDSTLFVYTHQKRLAAYDLEGLPLWERTLDVSPSANRHGPYYRAGELLFFGDADAEFVTYDAQSGDELHRLTLEEGPTAKILQAPDFVDNRVVVSMKNQIIIIDLAEKDVASRYVNVRGMIQKTWVFPAYPDQVIIAYAKPREQPFLAGISLSRGDRIWEYRDLNSGSSRGLWVYPDDTNLYVVYGDDKRQLTAINVRPAPENDRFVALKMWPQEEVFLGGFFIRDPNLVLTNQYVIFPNPDKHTVSMYDRVEGDRRHIQTEPIRRFLIDKRSKFQCDLIDGRLVFITDRGDAAFESRFERLNLHVDREKIRMLRSYLANSRDWNVVEWLASNFFRDGNSGAALHLLNESLLSEHLPSLDHPGKYQELKYILDGIKEEALKEGQPEILCRRFQTPPVIDGKLNESWNFTHRVEMKDLSSINQIPSPGQEDDVWKGREDLSATLYTGWDPTYFYFAMDVEDNQIYPYDKDAQYWRGDCLVIGIDPTGDGGMHHRNGDQLLTLALTVPNRKADKDREGEEGDEDEDEEDENKPDGIYTVKKKDDNSGVIYEVAIPWSLLQDFDNEIPDIHPNKVFGLSLVVTDDDTGQGSTKMISSTPCHLLPREQSAHAIWKHLVPEYFPKVRLK